MRLVWLRILFWTAALSLGGAQTWYSRHRMFSDGISYLTIAQQYASGDWHSALNAYWSPLYSWLIAAYLVAFRPSQYWEASSMHVINLAAFLLGCFFFEKVVGELVRQRPRGDGGFTPRTLWIAGYVTILQGGLWLIGIGYDSPDMAAFCLIGAAAWITMRIAGRNARTLEFAALGAVLGFGYLDRAAFAPLSVVYLLAVAFLVKKPAPVVVCTLMFVLVGAPFAVALSRHYGFVTIGESGKLNYGWEVDGAARTTHWQGEPGDIGRPVHPTRLILREPVPVYEFGAPVAGAYPPWYDPSYWYRGIQPILKPGLQLRALWTNIKTTGYDAAYLGVFSILVLILAVSGGRAIQPWLWPKSYAAVAVPAAAGIGLYCLVFMEKRYISGFLVLTGITALAGATIRPGRFGRWMDTAAQVICAVFFLLLMVRLREPLSTAANDLAHGREREGNIAWMLARTFEKAGVKPGDAVAYIGLSIDADWVRMTGARIVAEVPVTYDRAAGLSNNMEVNESYPNRFFALDEASREKVYSAFRKAGAVLVAANHVPEKSDHSGWIRALDPADPKYPATDAQITTQATTYYRWLVTR